MVRKRGCIKLNIKKVTFTGADDKTDPNELIKISHDYPFVEWGILFPSYGFSRFPSDKWVKELVDLSRGTDINLSAHFCEPWVEDIITNGDHLDFIRDYLGHGVFDAFKRIQFNFHGLAYQLLDSRLANILKRYTKKQFIFQADNLNSWIGLSVEAPNVALLLDNSHGAGVFTNEWKTFPKPFGFAGGLNIDTLPLAIMEWTKLQDHVEWIDMETGVIDKDGFSIPKVKEILSYVVDGDYCGN